MEFEPDLSELAAYLDREGHDGYLIDADSEDSDQRYVSGFDAPDPFVTLFTPEGTHLLVSGLEYGRARSASRADSVARLGEYDYRANVAEHGRQAGRARTVAAFLADHGATDLAAPSRFPLATADALREEGVAVEAESENVVESIRAVKQGVEVEAVRTAQRANEAAMAAAQELIEGAAVEDGVLYEGGEPLTSERVAEEIEVTLLRHGCALDETIVACGTDAADPHDRGSGPLRAGEPVIVDIFPRSKETGYHADMTRTVVRGDPSEEVRAFHDAAETALDAALNAIEPGATGEAVDDAVSEVFEERGYPTLRADETAETGFIHSTGHGVGLDVHESPRLGQGAEAELEPGHVVTVEPGLYDPEVGGVRVEDLVVVTDDGHENLTSYPRVFGLA
jgi:Xaa-Pro aminopeptidase